ncbi:hypothetical protein GGI12_005102 [Dipsacomyces acuminosporus]|nr:hypothetical protein GGI12_005102 [Dipsacomyces acuminosporus]
MANASALATRLRSLHKPGEPLVLGNVFDAHSAEIIASHPATKAIATASFAVAGSHGLDDDALKLETNLAVLRSIKPIAEKYDKPVTVDLQNGYGDRLEEAITSIIAEGASGCNLEDHDSETGELFPVEVAADRVRRAVAAAKKAGVDDFVLNARVDSVFIHGDVDDAVRRGKAYLEAGATTVFVFGGPQRGLSTDEVVRLIKEFDGRLNVMKRMAPGALSVKDIAELGAARISVGPQLWRRAMAAYKEAVDELYQ